MREAGIKVLLGGQGGDEAFMGYRKFHWFWLKELLAKRHYQQALAFLWQSQQLLLAQKQRLHTLWRARQRYFTKTKQNTLF